MSAYNLLDDLWIREAPEIAMRALADSGAEEVDPGASRSDDRYRQDLLPDTEHELNTPAGSDFTPAEWDSRGGGAEFRAGCRRTERGSGTYDLTMPDVNANDDFEPDTRDHLQIHIDVYCDVLTVAEMTEILGVAPDRGHSRGDVRPRWGALGNDTVSAGLRSDSLWSIWSQRDLLAFDDDHLDDLWPRASIALPRVVDLPSPTVFLRFNHIMDGRSYQGHSIGLSATWVQLLAVAGATIDIDQYINAEGNDTLD